MTLLIIKATLILVVALALLRLSRSLTASLRHRLAAATFGVLLLLPVVASLAPARRIAVPVVTIDALGTAPHPGPLPVERGEGGAERSEATGEGSISINWKEIALATYLFGAAFFAVSLFGGIWRLHRVRANADVSVHGTKLAKEIAAGEGIRQPVEVMISSALAVPITFGASRSTILLPAESGEWDDVALRRAIRHELEHIQRNDWMTQVLSRLACALYWPHPLVWALWQRLRLEAERACDDAVVCGDAAAEEYAEQLVSLARRVMDHGHVPALAMATRSNLGQRVEAILDRTLRRGRLGRVASTTVAIVAVALLVGLAPLQAAVEERDLEGDPRLLKYAGSGDIDALRLLIARGADVNGTIDGDGTALIVAAKHGQLDAVRFLVENGADVDLGVEGDGNPLIMAADKGHVEVVRYLLDRGADIDKVVPGDENALICASASGEIDTVRLLIERGANVNARVLAESWNGNQSRGEWRTPLNQARRNGHDDVVRLLRSAGARD